MVAAVAEQCHVQGCMAASPFFVPEMIPYTRHPKKNARVVARVVSTQGFQISILSYCSRYTHNNQWTDATAKLNGIHLIVSLLVMGSLQTYSNKAANYSNLLFCKTTLIITLANALLCKFLQAQLCQCTCTVPK